MLAMGSRGIDIQELQRDLTAIGFDPGPVDGIFGPVTQRAVVELQRYCGLPADGTVGHITHEALRSLRLQYNTG